MRWRLAALAFVLAFAPATAARACPPPATYPGDAAPKTLIAQWMAAGMQARGLPGELPVMGALTESGLSNLPGTDSVGFFEMRVSIWDQGPYASFPANAALQLQWFGDHAIAVRDARLAAGLPDPLPVEAAWGDWIADVLLPREDLRGRYQPRLQEARDLIGVPCSPAPDLVAPALRAGGARHQHAVRRGGLVVRAACPAEPCIASATATIRPPGARRALRLGSRPRVLAAGGSTRLRLVLSTRLRRTLRRALRRGATARARVRIVAADGAGNTTRARRTVRVTG